MFRTPNDFWKCLDIKHRKLYVAKEISKGESVMSYWKDKTFTTIYRRIQKEAQRHPEQSINVLAQARREYYQTKDSIKLVSGKYTPTPTNNLNRNVTTEKVEEPPAPPIEEDKIVNVAGMRMLESEWTEIKRIFKGGTIAEKTQICAEHAKRKEYRLLKAEFLDTEE